MWFSHTQFILPKLLTILTLVSCQPVADPTDTGEPGDTGEFPRDAHPAPRFTIHVVDSAGAPLTADSAWADDDQSNRYEGDFVDAACTEWTGIAADGRVTLYAEAGGVVSEGVEDVIIRDESGCSVESAKVTVTIAG